MAEDWAKKLSAKISGFKNETADPDPRSERIFKAAEKSREFADEMLFRLFIEKIDAVNGNLADGKGGFFGRLFKREPLALEYSISKESVFRFEAREAWGSRLEIDFNRGSLPMMFVDVAVSELIDGEYRPFIRDMGAAAGAQIWFGRRSDGKHPELIGRLLFLLSAAALDDGLKIRDSVSWVYEENRQSFNSSGAERLLESLISSA